MLLKTLKNKIISQNINICSVKLLNYVFVEKFYTEFKNCNVKFYVLC